MSRKHKLVRAIRHEVRYQLRREMARLKAETLSAIVNAEPKPTDGVLHYTTNGGTTVWPS